LCDADHHALAGCCKRARSVSYCHIQSTDLRAEDAFKLLKLLAPSAADKNRDDCMELIDDLEALPLAIHVAGRLLRAETSLGWGVRELMKELRNGAAIINAKAPLDRADVETQTIPTVAALLRKSIEGLDENIRDCFAVIGAFAPKPATFHLKALQSVWQTEPKPILRELVNRGLLEPIGNERFRMHALHVAQARSMLPFHGQNADLPVQ